MAEPLPAFVRRRKASWEELAALLDSLEKGSMALLDPGRLDRLYRRTASDLAHARTFYPGSDAEVYSTGSALGATAPSTEGAAPRAVRWRTSSGMTSPAPSPSRRASSSRRSA